MLVMKMRSSSPVNRLVGLYRGFMCMYKKKKKKKVASYSWLSPATGESRLKWLSSKKKKKKGKKKKVVLIGYFAYYIPLWDQCIK